MLNFKVSRGCKLMVGRSCLDRRRPKKLFFGFGRPNSVNNYDYRLVLITGDGLKPSIDLTTTKNVKFGVSFQVF